MKNEKGQVLVLFIMILPLLLLGGACIVDSSYMLYQKNRLDNINRDVLNSVNNSSSLSEEVIDEIIRENDAKIVNDEISIDEKIVIKNHVMVDSLFGKIIGIDKYRVNSEVSVKAKRLILDIDSLKNIDNTGNYSVINNNVIYDGGLVFKDSDLLINNFNMNGDFEVNISFSFEKNGNLLEFNNLLINISNDELFINGKRVTSLKIGEKYDLVITKDRIVLNGDSSASSNDIDNYTGDLIIGKGFSGKIEFIKIYNIGN